MSTNRKWSRRASVLAALTTVTAMSGGAALADDISNNLDASIDATAEVMALNVDGATGTTTLYVSPTNGDGKNGCNLTGSTTLALNVASNNAAVATVSPSSVTFTSCGDTKTLTVTPVAQGSATISVSQAGNNTGGTFNLAPATFTVDVAPPANTAPNVSIAGVAGGANYDKSSVPAATCEVTDAEDGNQSFAATLSAVTGPYAADGIGSQTASCSYTDKGGLSESASATYSIVDSSAPSIGYTLDPALPDGAENWYRSQVRLTWNVAETDSPSSLQAAGCNDQLISVDQEATVYSCAASSAGGVATEVAVSIKRDATAPVVLGDDVVETAWRNTPLSHSFTASDARSGLANGDDAAFTLTASNESASASEPTVVSKTVMDKAGNETERIVSARIDQTDPTVSPANVVDGTWRNTPLTQAFTALDSLSGLASQADATFSLTAAAESPNAGEPTVVSRTVTDVAGNSTTRTVSALIDTTKPTLSLSGGPVGTLYYGDVVHAPSCNAFDDQSGLASACSVTGGGTAVGTHTYTAIVTDNAGNTSTASMSYDVLPWSLKGFYSPVDMNGVYNTVKGGSTVPLKFELFAGSGELTDTADIKSFTTQKITCAGSAIEDALEIVSTGGTSLRYDATGGQFIQNWKTPTGAGTCHKATMTAQDGSTISANFKIK